MDLALKKKETPCNNKQRKEKRRERMKWKVKEKETLTNIFHLLLRPMIFDSVFWS